MPEIFTAPKNTGKKKLLPTILSSFYEKPSGIRFRDQRQDEKVFLLLRRHWVTNLPWIFIALVLLLLPLLIFPLINFNLPFNFTMIGFVFWYLLTFGFILINFLFWFYNIGIITNERVIDVDFIYLLYSEVTTALLEKIEDVTDKRSGFLSILVDMGSVFIQTAGTEPNIEFKDVPKPSLVVKLLNSFLQRRK